MNKKAIITYFILLLFVVIMYFYIQDTLSKLTVTTTTLQSSNTSSNLTAIKGNSSSLVVTTVVTTGYYTTVSCSQSQTLITPGNCQESTTTNNIFSNCTAFGGFTCSNLFLSSTTGNLTFTFSETQYANWASAQIFLLNSTTAPKPEKGIVNLTNSVNILNVSNSEQITVTVPAIKPKLPKGVNIAGNIWALFRLKGSNTTYVSEIAKFKAQSV